MEKEKLTPVLEILKEAKKELLFLEEKEQEKYKVGLLLDESIRALRVCIPSLIQPGLRLDKRKKRVENLKEIGLNLMELCRIFRLVGSYRANPPEFFLDDKKTPHKKAKKEPVKVSR